MYVCITPPRNCINLDYEDDCIIFFSLIMSLFKIFYLTLAVSLRTLKENKRG